MRKINIVPNLITGFGLACGLFVIFKVNLTGEPSYVLLKQMVYILLLAAIADLIDGAVARLIHAESQFGILFDSLADSVSFGVAPSVLLLKALSLSSYSFFAFFIIASAMVYTVSGVIRLVRFNVKHAMLGPNDPDKKVFIGLPIPAAMLGSVSITLLLYAPWIGISARLEPWLLALIMGVINIFLGYLMVSKIRFPSFKQFTLRKISFRLLFVTSFLILFCLYG